MGLKRYLAGSIILLALTGCGKADVPSVGMEETEKTEEAEIIAEDEKPQDPVEMIPDADETEWEKVEGAAVATFYIDIKADKEVPDPDTANTVLCEKMVRISTENELEYLTGDDCRWRFLDQEMSVFIQTYPIEEYDYVMCRSDITLDTYSDNIEYCGNKRELRFHHVERYNSPGTMVILYDRDRIPVDVAAIPKDFFRDSNIEELLISQEVKEWAEALAPVAYPIK